VGAVVLGAAGAAAPAQSAAATAPVAVSISATRVVTMPTAVQPGVNIFRVTSAAKRGSSFQLAQPAPGYTVAEAARDIEKGLNGGNVKALKRFEANVTLLGGAVADDTAVVVVDLDPGTYWAVDTNTNDPDKFFTFTAEGADTGRVMPEADATIKAVQDTTWARKPASIPHKGLLKFKNAATQNHFIAMVKLKKGKTYRDFKKWFAASENGPSGPSPVNFEVGLDSGVLSPGHSAEFRYNLPKGDYVMLCFWPDASMGGMPHAYMGMHRAITLN